ncbi:TPA: hypothetical protein PXN43_000752 [Yersinia enterocolitica]|nr:hypothetical protein [Yersinia enterocolitica]HDM8081183.1 hypothetical protein [Yersinia enterocolitica]
MVQDSQNTDLLYDYLYIDKERVGALTAQLFSCGVMTTLKQSSSESDNNKKEVKIKIPIVAGGISAGETVSRTQERMFDSSWSLPLNLLDKLSEQNRIKKNIGDAKLGDLVIISGMMKIFDAEMVHKFMPAFKKLTTMNLKATNNQSQKNALKTQITQLDSAEELVKFLPLSTQIDFADSDGNLIWMSVNPSNLTIGTGDIALKYGPLIPSKWHVLGYVDAYPQDKLDDPEAPYPYIENDIKNGMDTMLMLIRQLMGRGENSYGMTPLIIFRSIN